MPRTPERPADIRRARALAVLGDSITTDHISPAGSIPAESPAGKYLMAHGVTPKEFNSYGARRGNHQVMMRGTFANIRLRNRLVPGTEGGLTVHFPDGARMSIYDAAMQYARERVELVVLAGKEYGAGSSRDWAAKGPRLLGVRAVIAESFERIHRANLLFMGVLPLELDARGRHAGWASPGRRSSTSRPRGAGAAQARARGAGGGPGAGRPRVPGDGARRHAEGARVLPARRASSSTSCGSCPPGRGR